MSACRIRWRPAEDVGSRVGGKGRVTTHGNGRCLNAVFLPGRRCGDRAPPARALGRGRGRRTGRLGGPRGLRGPVRRRLRHGSSPSGPRYHDATGSEGNRTTSRLRPPSQAQVHVTPGAADRTSRRPRCRYRSPRRCWLGRRWLREPGRLHRGHGGRRGHPGVAGPPSTPVRQRPPWWAQHLRRTQAAIPLHFTGPRGTARVGGGWVSVAPRVTVTTNVWLSGERCPRKEGFH